MYHFRSLPRTHKRSPQRAFGRKALSQLSAGLLTTAALLSAAILPAQASAAQTKSARQVISQTKLSVMNGADVNKIDWRQPEMKLRFDLTESDWIDGMDMILSMSPMGKVGKREPVLVSLNNGPPLRLNPRGQSFDARLKFDSSFIRAKGNILTIRTPAPGGAACLTSEHGSWDVNLKKSSIVVRTRAKSRDLYLREVTERLANPATTPKTVAILARGADKARYEMLAAQGIALQTPSIPKYRTQAGQSEMEIIIARRDELAPHVSDRSILSDTGSKISLHKGRPMRLVITGDTDLQVSAAAKSFASHSLPPVRRRHTSTGELNFQRAFADKRVELSKRTHFSDLDKGYYAMDWRATPNVLTFNVADPATQSGEVLLRLSSSEKIAKDSKVNLELNGKALGFATLDRRRKSVAFTIPQGALRGHANELKITPMLNKKTSVETFGQACPSLDDTPGFTIGNGSRIELVSAGASPATELSRLTANGGQFALAGGVNTHIILPARGRNDYNAALKVLAQLAKSSGTGWTEATVSRNHEDMAQKNILVIGPKSSAAKLLARGPRALSAALNGKSSHGQLVSNAGTYEKFASADSASTLALYANKTRPSSRIGSGGVAAIFPDNNRLIGVISNTPGRSFSSVTQDLLSDKQWNKLHGSVSRWNSKSVLMTQTPIDVQLSALPQVKLDDAQKRPLPSLDMAWLNEGLTSAAMRWEDLTDSLAIKLDDYSSRVGTALAGREDMIQKRMPQTTPRPPKLTSEYAEKMKAQKARPAEVITRPTLKNVAAKHAQTGTQLTASLRGFSKPGQMKTSEPKARSWLSNLMGKLKPRGAAPKNETQIYTQAQNEVQIPTGQKFNSPSKLGETMQATQQNMAGKFKSFKTENSEKLTMINQNASSYPRVLLGLVLILIVLLISLVTSTPTPKKPDHGRLFNPADPWK